MSDDLLLRNGRIIDPANGIDMVGDVLLSDGRIERVGKRSAEEDELRTIDCTGKVIAPGLIDIHVHLREPGFAWNETIESGARAAAAGGFTTIVCMPNTSPVADSPSTIAWIKDRAAAKAFVNVLPTGAISKGLAGEELADDGGLAQAFEQLPGELGGQDDDRDVQKDWARAGAHGLCSLTLLFSRDG